MAPERRRPVGPPSGGPAPQIPLARAAVSDPAIPRTPPSGPHDAAAPAGTSSRLLALRTRGIELWRSPRGRRIVVGAAVALELAALAAVITIGLDSSVDAVVRPASMTGTVHDVGVGGVNLRSAPQVATSTARSVALDGTALMIQCGVTGAVVSGPAGDSPLWFRTADDRYVSMLYVRVPGRAFVPSCGASADAPLIAVVNPDLPASSPGAIPGDPSTGAVPGAANPATVTGGGAGSGSTTGGRGRRGGTGGAQAAPAAPGGPNSRAVIPATPDTSADAQHDVHEDNSVNDSTNQDNGGGQDNGGQNGDQPQG